MNRKRGASPHTGIGAGALSPWTRKVSGRESAGSRGGGGDRALAARQRPLVGCRGEALAFRNSRDLHPAVPALAIVLAIVLALVTSMAAAFAQPRPVPPSSQKRSSQPPSSTAHPLRIVFLLHGWNGSTESFGGLPALLAAGHPGLWPDGYFTVIPIEAAKAKARTTILEQVADCGRQMVAAAEKVEAGIASTPDRHREIYAITHSMGGLILRQLWLDHAGKDDALGGLMRDLKTAILVAPPNQGSDEVRFAMVQIESKLMGVAGELLSERSLKSLTNQALKRILAGMPLEQAVEMASGSDFVEALNARWARLDASHRFPGWILAGAHDMVVDLANANLDYQQVRPGPDGRLEHLGCSIPPERVRYYPYNHANTNRRDGILGSIASVDHPVFADIARILLDRPLPPMVRQIGSCKIFLRLGHPATDRITRVIVDPFDKALTGTLAYEQGLAEGKVVGFRERDLVVLAGSPESLLPVAGTTVLILKTSGERHGVMPRFLPYMPRLLAFEGEYGPVDLVRDHTVTYRPIQVLLSPGLLTPNSVLTLTVDLSEAPAPLPEAVTLVSGEGQDLSASIQERRTRARQAIAGKDSLEVARQLRKLGATQDPALVPVLVDYTAATYPVPLRRAALAALGDLHAAEALDPLTTAATDADPSVRAIAIDALGRVPSADAVGLLLSILNTPSRRANHRAALAGVCQVAPSLMASAITAAIPPQTRVAASQRSRLTSIALACPRVSTDLIVAVARQAIAADSGRTAPDHYGRILDALTTHASPVERTWLRQMRREVGQGNDTTWTRSLMTHLVSSPAGTALDQ